ncbi:MAG: N-acyl-D-amino-acid deacylase family protein [Burkholderiaceae bacterium]
MDDVLIRGARIVDGSGAAAFTADLSFKDGVITGLGAQASGSARQVINADGCILTPAWVDIHSHYDGQVTWDEAMEPSAGHGVGTVVMGNCGVGFAPVPPGGEQQLIELMEGVEDIPGSVLSEGMPWGQWSSYPEYLDLLATRRYALDVGSMIAHAPVRNAVMGDRGRRDETATAEELAAMQSVVEQALRAGALGFSTSRIRGHRTVRGDPVPGTFVDEAEVLAFGAALKNAGHGVYQIIPSSTVGSAPALGGEKHSLMEEIELMGRASIANGRPLTFTLFQIDEWKDLWRQALERVVALNRDGAQLYPQVGPRPTAIVMSLATYHPFMRKPSYLALRELPLTERVRRMKDPECRSRILAESNQAHELPGKMENVVAHMMPLWDQTFRLSDAEDHEPCSHLSVGSIARAQGRSASEVLYDMLLEEEGQAFVMRYFTNYSDHDLEAVRQMQEHPATVSGLGDAGAHVSVIFDAVHPTYMLTHWVRDRRRGPRLALEQVVHRQTGRNATLFGLHDRGLLREGLRADLNLIDLDRLALGRLAVHRDLPAGGARLLQPASGYVATFVRGTRTRDHDRDTGLRPGRLVRGGGAVLAR